MNASILSHLIVVMLILSVTPGVGPAFAAEQAVGVWETIRGGDIDVFTQRGGAGASVPSAPFCPGSEVFLYARVTYSGWPEQNSDVAFQILTPLESSFLLFGRTNASGIATVRYRLPSADYLDDISGPWTVIASVDIAETVVQDRLTFYVWWNLADVNHDFKVNLYDAVLMSQTYGSTSSDPSWNPCCDVANPYGIIDLYDVELVVTNYGQKYAP
jgi:hypothetical protein